MALIDLKFATITISDGTTPTPNFVIIDVGAGSLEFVEKHARETVKRRGELDAVRDGDEDVVEVTFQFVWETLTALRDADPPTVEDALKRRGHAAGWASVSPDPEAPFAVNLAVQYSPPCGGTQTIYLAEFYYEELSHSLVDASIDCKGISNRTAAVQVNS